MALKMKLNKDEMTNKILGCWIGKNIGGTMGTPYEGAQQLNDISGFNSPKGEPLPNDDLDLQLVWLQAMEDVGPKGMSANVLADYWLSYITPHWNEYGIGKSNLEMGLLPPLSGQFKNTWKDSNGAWIRSEIWACLAPGIPNVAVKYAIMDASIDHGLAEGTYAEVFTASLESMAFFESDIRTLVENALTFIPQNCRVARSVRIVLDSYDKKIPWIQVREMLVEDSADLGWFQAPANVAFTVLGLIYGEGDFKKSIIYAIDCGDDTDCTGATCGALLGIIMGADKIPADWKEYIGDRIITICVNASYRPLMPATCAELTDRVLDTLPTVMKAYGIDVEYTDGENQVDEALGADILNGYAQGIFARSPYSFDIPGQLHTEAFVEYQCEPVVRPNSEFNVKITLKNNRLNSYHYEFDVCLPEGWSAEYDRTCYIHQKTLCTDDTATWEMKLLIGEKVDSINKIPVMISPKGHAVPVMVPIVLLG
ncbi:MAG: ADP-ribosylglycohydrolase family protein [Clostridia bacterium]|nr:ADP-ribosylglycohydrolase family protein [Clostridia bacterium]